MSSILTNTGAMVALQSLKSINSGLAKTQNEISTGKMISSAKDNSAIWAISKVMESDVQGFKAISGSLSLGESTVAVARQASETITDLLTQMKNKIVAGQQDNIDRGKLQDDVAALRDQVESVVNAAQFNGLNLVNGAVASTDVLSSLDRDGTGNVTDSSITVDGQDLSIGAYVTKDVFTGTTGVSGNADTFGAFVDAGDDTTVVFAEGGAFAEGDRFTVNIGDDSVSYTVTAADAAATTTADIVATAIRAKIDGLGNPDIAVDYDSGTPGTLVITNNTANDLAVSGNYANQGAGGLGALDGIDVSTAAGATAALGSIENLIQTSIDAAAAFGSAQGRIETQADFISGLTDALKTGIGSLVDADMEAASARLQALQVQQQLGVQSLSIANQAPQSILSLFR